MSRPNGGPRGRPVKTNEDRLDSLISFRVNAETYSRILSMALSQGMSPSTFARDLVERAIREADSVTNVLGRRIKVRR